MGTVQAHLQEEGKCLSEGNTQCKKIAGVTEGGCTLDVHTARPWGAGPSSHSLEWGNQCPSYCRQPSQPAVNSQSHPKENRCLEFSRCRCCFQYFPAGRCLWSIITASLNLCLQLNVLEKFWWQTPRLTSEQFPAGRIPLYVRSPRVLKGSLALVLLQAGWATLGILLFIS